MNDRFLRACRREPVDRTPVWFMRQAGRSQPQYRALRERHSLLDIVRNPELGAEVTLRPVHELEVDAAVLFADITLPFLSMGVGFELGDGGPQIHHPIRTDDDVAGVQAFAVDQTIAAVLETIRIVRARSPVPLIGFAGAPFTMASYLVEGGPSKDYLHTKMMMYGQPETWRALMDALTDMTIRYLLIQVEAGAQAVQLFDSWVGCLSPVDYTRYVAPYTRRVLDALRPAGVPAIHFGTGTAGLLALMAGVGGDVIGVDWRIDLDRAWEAIGHDRAIQGNLEPAVLLAPSEVIRERTIDVLRRAAGRPGHIFNLGHGVLPDTPREHLVQVVQTVRAFVAEPEMERTR
ncbi:MAG TPA: uroporphyrinogen decarboxylase [bacterium]|nr:uroporphyrinogen decarboxylase [bacterium]